MQYLIFKYFITASIVVIVSEVARRNERIGALIAALPIVALLTLIWLYVEKQSEQRLANYALYTFWYVLPTLPMFVLFFYALPKYGFLMTLCACILLTILLFVLLAYVLKPFGIQLL